MNYMKGLKWICVGIAVIGIVFWMIGVYRVNHDYENAEIVLPDGIFESHGFRIDDVSATIYDPAVLCRDASQDLEEYLIQDAAIDYMNFQGYSKTMIVTVCVTNQTQEDVSVQKTGFPLGVKCISWFNGNDPMGYALLNGTDTISSGKSAEIYIPITLCKEHMGESLWENLGGETYYLVMNIDNRFYDFPIVCPKVINGTDEENDVFIKKVQSYIEEFQP